METRTKLRRKIFKRCKIRSGIEVRPVVITSYEITIRDRKLLQNFEWRYLIVDEGHRIKNTHCRLIRYKARAILGKEMYMRGKGGGGGGGGGYRRQATLIQDPPLVQFEKKKKS